MNELKERADMYHRHFIKRTFFKKWNIASISSAMNKEKLEYAIDNDRWRVLFYAFNTMKENVGICVLIKLLDLRRDENLMKNMFYLWYSKTQTDTFVDDRVVPVFAPACDIVDKLTCTVIECVKVFCSFVWNSTLALESRRP